MQYAYGGLFLISALLMPIYFVFCHKKQSEPWLLLFFICVSIVNLGYFLISISGSVEFALFANKITYFGQVIIPLCMFVIIAKLCGFKLNKIIIGVLIGFATVMFCIVCTTGYLNWYYTNTSIEVVSGATILVKEYGVLHPLNLIYVVLYFIGMITVLILSFIKNKGASQKHAVMLLIIILGNIFMWLIQKVIPWEFELLSITYLMSASAVLATWLMLQDYVLKKDIQPSTSINVEKIGIDILTMPMEMKIKKVLYFIQDGEFLGVREREILELILENKKRKEIAAALFLSENTVKTYTRTLYAKLGVTCREELYSLLLQNEE